MPPRGKLAGFGLLAMLLLVAGAAGQEKHKQLTPYRNLLVEPFSIEKSNETRDLPEEYAARLQSLVMERLRSSHLFDRVEELGTDHTKSCENCLILSGRIVHYGKGSRAARFWIGMGAGRAKVGAVFAFRRPDNNNEVLRFKAEGKHYGYISGQQDATMECLGDVVDRLVDKVKGK